MRCGCWVLAFSLFLILKKEAVEISVASRHACLYCLYNVMFIQLLPYLSGVVLLFDYHSCPAVLVLLCAVLYATQVVVELGRDRTGLAVLAECEALACVEVVDV